MRIFKIRRKLKSTITTYIAKLGDANFVAMKRTLLKTISKSTKSSGKSKTHVIARKRSVASLTFYFDKCKMIILVFNTNINPHSV